MTSSDSKVRWVQWLVPVLADAEYRRWRRIHALSGALPVGLFLVLHLLNNAVAIAGPDAFNALAARLDRLPAIAWLEAIAIGAPLVFHVVVGIVLGNTAQGAGDTRPYARPWLLAAQRATGAMLVVFVAFHVWGIRLAPVESGPIDLFSRTRAQIEPPAMFALYALGLASAAFHFGFGIHATLALWSGPAARRRSLAVAWIATLALGVVGFNAQLAFVSPRARWLEQPRYVQSDGAEPRAAR